MLKNDQIRKRILINSATMAVCRAGSAVFSLLLVPVVIAKLGVSGYGTWELIFSAATICSMMQSAVVNTLLWQISNAYGVEDEDRVRRVLSIGVTITLAQFIIIVPFVWFFRFDILNIFHVANSSVDAFALIMPLFCGIMILNGVSECIGTIISGYQRAGVVTMVQSLAQVLNYSASIGFLLAGFGLRSMFIGYAINYLFVGILYYFIARRLCPHLRIFPAIITREEIKNLRSYFSLMMVGAFSGIFRDEKDRLILSAYYSPEWVGYYSISLRLVGFITLMNNFFYVPILTAIGAINARGEWGQIRKIYADTIVIISVVVGFMALIIAGLHERILILWLGFNISEVGSIVLWLVFGSVTAILLTSPGTAICKGIGRMGMEASYWTLGIFFNLIFTLVFVPYFGPLGAIAASSLSWMISSIFFLYFFHKNMDISWRLSFQSVKGLVVIGLGILFAQYLSDSWSSELVGLYGFLNLSALIAILFVGYISLLMGAKIVPVGFLNYLLIFKRKNR